MTEYSEAAVRSRIARLKREKGELIAEGRSVNNRAKLEGRDLTPSEERRFNAILSRCDEITEEIRLGEDLIVEARPKLRNEAWRRRTFGRPA